MKNKKSAKKASTLPMKSKTNMVTEKKRIEKKDKKMKNNSNNEVDASSVN